MFFESYTAIRLARNDNKRRISLNRLTVIGVSLSIFVILISMSVIKGFKKRNKGICIQSDRTRICICSKQHVERCIQPYIL